MRVIPSLLLLLATAALAMAHVSSAKPSSAEGMTGGVRSGSIDDPAAKEAALFAVDALNDGHKLRSNLHDIGGLLTFVRIKDVQQQVVAGMMYHITFIVSDSNGTEHEVKAGVWSRPWLKNSNAEEAMQLTRLELVQPDANSA